MKLNDVYNKPIGFLDLETTGLDPEKHEILEIGAVVLTSDFKFKKAMNYRLVMEHPERADPKALKVNGYTPEGWRNAIPQKAGISKLLSFLSECGVCFAHNSTFDYGFLEFGVRRHMIDIPLPRYRLDTMTIVWLYQKPVRGWFTLKASCEAVSVRAEGPVHVAVNGALAGARFLREFLRQWEDTRARAVKWDFMMDESVPVFIGTNGSTDFSDTNKPSEGF